jgi:hypothetical protein
MLLRATGKARQGNGREYDARHPIHGLAMMVLHNRSILSNDQGRQDCAAVCDALCEKEQQR